MPGALGREQQRLFWVIECPLYCATRRVDLKEILH